MIWIRFLSNIYIQIYANFTPSATKMAQGRWKSWVVLFATMAFCGDQNIAPLSALGLYLLIWVLLDRPWISEEEKELRAKGLLKGQSAHRRLLPPILRSIKPRNPPL